MQTAKILDIDFSILTLKQTMSLISERIKKGGERFYHIITVNPEIAIQIQDDKELRDISLNADLLTPDGIGIIWASRIIRKPIPERVTGYDLLLESLEYGNNYGWSFYFLGSEEEVNRNMEAYVKKDYPNIKLLGRHNGYFDAIEEEKVVSDIEQLRPDILIIAFGAPLTDKWINKHKNSIKANVVFGVGGSMDVITGKVKKTPTIWKKLNLEWLHRRIIMPSRKDRQKKLKIFAVRVVKQALRMKYK